MHELTHDVQNECQLVTTQVKHSHSDYKVGKVDNYHEQLEPHSPHIPCRIINLLYFE